MGFETRRHSIQLCRAEAPSISVRWRRFLCENKDFDVGYCLCNRDAPEQGKREFSCNIVAWYNISHVDT